MRSIIVYSLVLLSILATSCSHYIGLPVDPNAVGTDNTIDMSIKMFLSIDADYQEQDNRLAITMRARAGRTGNEVFQIKDAVLIVNGEARELVFGFPYRGTPEQLFLPVTSNQLTLVFQSPTRIQSWTSFTLEQQPEVTGVLQASRTNGLVVAISPALRLNETLIAMIYKSTPSSARLLKSKTYSMVGGTSVSFDASDFVSEITGDEELILEISRSIHTFRTSLFSDGVELTQRFGTFARFVPIVP